MIKRNGLCKNMEETKDIITSLQLENQNLNISLRLEMMKNTIYRQIIELNTPIKLDEIMEVKEDGFYIYDSKYGLDIPVYMKDKKEDDKAYKKADKKADDKADDKADNKADNKIDRKIDKKIDKKRVKIKKRVMRPPESPLYVIEEESEYEDSVIDIEEESESFNKRRYKSVKNKEELADELTQEEKMSIIKEVESKRNTENREILRLKSEIKEVIEECFKSLVKSRIYTKILSKIKRERFKLLEFSSLTEYINLLEEHSNKLNTIFTEKNYPEKKIEKCISQSMCALDLRLIWNRSFTNSYIEIDEIEKFYNCLCRCVIFPQTYEPFVRDNLFSCFHNYGTTFFSIKKLIETYLFNPYGFYNVIYYLPHNKEEKSDPYTFYILERVENDKRYWRLDCRLEELCNDFRDSVRQYLILLFRRLYNAVFSDNEYRQDYLLSGQLMESDCEQLVQSILLLSNPRELCKLFRNVVKANAKYTATKNDKFNMYGDDPLQKKRLNNPSSKDEPDIIDIVKELFDNMRAEDAVDFYRSRTSNIV